MTIGSIKVGEVMTRGVECVPAEMSVRDAALVMAEHDIGSVLVGSLDQPQGILTDRDIILRVVIAGGDPRQIPVRDVMSKHLFTCRVDDPIEAVLQQMDEQQVRRLPVLDRRGQLVGIVVRITLTQLIIKSLMEAACPEAAAQAGGELGTLIRQR